MPQKTTSSASDLLAAMEKLGGTGQFATSGTHPFFLPELFVEGVGEVAFPLVPAQIRELLAAAEEAPFGQGEKTVHDHTVRQCHQLDAARLEFRSPEWKKYLKEILTQIREDLGIESKISAHPYKLLIYGPGGHFRPHRDTEKLDAMFGTLLIALPSSHEGGLLTIRHGGEEVAVDFSDPRHTRAFQHVAFFADCEHGVEPVREGYRCCVVYNLRLDSGSPGRLNRSVEEQARTLVPLLQSLAGDMAADPVAVLLDHGYTEANFSLANLKGRDRLRARALLHAADQADLTAHLALLELHQSGELEMEYRGRGRRGWGGYGEWDVDPENGTMGEIHEESLTLSHWRDAHDSDPGFGEFVLERERIISREAIDAGDPDEKEAEGYTGNAGCTMDYWYRGAAIVLWPKEQDELVLARKNIRAACQRLHLLAGKKPKSAAFQRLADAILQHFRETPPGRFFNRFSVQNHDAPFVTAARALARAKAESLFDLLLDEILLDTFSLCQTEDWQEILSCLGSKPLKKLVTLLSGAEDDMQRRILFQVLPAALKVCQEDAPTRDVAVQASQIVSSRLWVPPVHQIHLEGLRGEISSLLSASHLLTSKSDRQGVMDFVGGDSSVIAVREVLAPALLALPSAKPAPGSLIPDAARLAIEVLATETNRPLRPYPDWTRPCPATSPERDFPYGLYSRPRSSRGAEDPITELRKFMADPAREEHAFARVQSERSTLERFILSNQLDLDCQTIRKGSPHTLLCRKNSQSLLRARQIRQDDEHLLAALRKKFTRYL